MSQSNHTLYKGKSPYYDSLVGRYGRTLRPIDVEGILYEHSIELSDYLGDPDIALGDLPAETDAADLLAWLGY